MKLTRLMGALAAVAMAGGVLGGGALPAAEPDRDDQRPPQVLPKGFESTDQLQRDLERTEGGPLYSLANTLPYDGEVLDLLMNVSVA